MKKLLSIAVCFAFVLTFAGCKDDKKKTNDEVDLQYYAELGQIPELEYKLGSNVAEIKNKLSAEYEEFLANDPANSEEQIDDHDTEDKYYNVSEKDDYTIIDQGNKAYYYKTGNENDGVSAIMTYGNAFGIEMGTFIYDLKNKMPSIDFSETQVNENDLFYADYIMDGTALTAEFDDVTVQFVFEDGSLYCTAIYRTAIWK